MPHFGLMDEDALGPVEGPLMRAKLHIRCGMRRIREGKISMGIITLYDALVSAMQWYTAEPGNEKKIKIDPARNMNNDKDVYETLIISGVLDGKYDYEELNTLVDRALAEEITSSDYRNTLIGMESVLTQLGVMPFDERELPPEDPSTF